MKMTYLPTLAIVMLMATAAAVPVESNLPKAAERFKSDYEAAVIKVEETRTTSANDAKKAYEKLLKSLLDAGEIKQNESFADWTRNELERLKHDEGKATEPAEDFSQAVAAKKEYVAASDLAAKTADTAKGKLITDYRVKLQSARTRSIATGDAKGAEEIAKLIDQVDQEIADGRGLKSRRIVFICDTRGSMLSIFHQAKAQMKRSINGLSPDQRYNVIFLGETLHMNDGGMVAATDANKRKNEDLIDNMVCEGQTTASPAFREAFSEKPDAIYVLCDGFGQEPQAEPVEETVKRFNPKKAVHVHVVFFHSYPGTDAVQVNRAKKITADNGGTFEDVTTEDH